MPRAIESEEIFPRRDSQAFEGLATGSPVAADSAQADHKGVVGRSGQGTAARAANDGDGSSRDGLHANIRANAPHPRLRVGDPIELRTDPEEGASPSRRLLPAQRSGGLVGQLAQQIAHRFDER